ncbi:hypothetical protein [Conexibacter sp. SYSU D00693]|uniref:hypothetical protein n=1 Tax=Conexibacter sp. SYSU D00693 TaxID=2812560 RepID=UPI00196B2634|nr:hypothetical protein [Conexibacter sp. SYSU D00693]
MSVLAIVLLVVVAVLVLLFVGGYAGNARRRAARAADLRRRVAAANEALAAAHAEDNGWAPSTVEAAAREAFAAQHPGAPIDELHLVQVVDLPGTDADEAVFRVVSHGADHDIRLGRQGGAWVPAAPSGR